MPTLLPVMCFLVVPTFSLEPLFHLRLLASGCLCHFMVAEASGFLDCWVNGFLRKLPRCFTPSVRTVPSCGPQP